MILLLAISFFTWTTEAVQEKCVHRQKDLHELEKFASLELDLSCVDKKLVHKLQKVDSDRHLNGKHLADFVAPTIIAKHPQKNWFQVDYHQLSFTLFNGTPVKYEGHREDMTQLRHWLWGQKDLSVGPESLFLKAMEISHGDVQRAIELCYNNFTIEPEQAFSGERSSRWHVLKMKDITGEQELFNGNGQEDKESVYSSRGDVYSAYYHFFGTALHAFARKNTYTGITLRLPTSALVWMEESLLSHDVKDNLKRKINDEQGIEFANRLAEILKDPKSFHSGDKKFLESRPDLYGEKWAMKPGPSSLTTMGKVVLLRKLMLAKDSKIHHHFTCYAEELLYDNDESVALSALSALAQTNGPETKKLLQKISKKQRMKNVRLTADCLLHHEKEKDKISCLTKFRPYFEGLSE